MGQYQCINCDQIFSRSSKDDYNIRVRGGRPFCGKVCFNLYLEKSNVIYSCGQCGKLVKKSPYAVKESQSGHNFCSRSCSVTYQNTHKIRGIRRSKLELFLEERLDILYPDLEVHYNRKDAINSELDIYIPSLQLAFELNGVFHYEPIFGSDKLSQIQNNDERKFQACLERGIELCIIDVSYIKWFNEERGNKILSIISNIVQNRNRRESNSG